MMNVTSLHNIPIPFAVWELPGQERPEYFHDDPHVAENRIIGVSVPHGQRFADGPGAIVTSYDPRLLCVDRPLQVDGNRTDSHGGQHFDVVVRGPVALGRTMAQRFADALKVDLEVMSQTPARDVFVQCGHDLVPALEFDIGIPEATVIVSANLSTHPVALGFWRWPVALPPVLELAGFDWE